MFNWNLCEDEDEIVEVLCGGISYLNRDDLLTFVSSVIYHEGFEFKEIAARIEEVDGAIFDIEKSSKRIFDKE
jgi:hypothetical protein